MIQLSLGKVIRKKRFAPLLQRLVAALESPLVIEDGNGELLLATEGASEGAGHPVTVQGETIGWVRGGEKAELLASWLTYQAGIELERKNLGSETLHKYKEITLLYEMADKIPASMDRKEIAHHLIDQIKQVIQFSSISVLLLNKRTGTLEVVASIGQDYEIGENFTKTGIMGSILASGKGEIVNDVAADPRFVKGSGKISSLMCAPLKSKETMTGVIELTSAEPMTYTAEDLKLFTTLSAQAAVQIENATLYLQLKEAFYTMVYTLAETIEKRDPYTGNHTKRVMEYSLALGRTMGLPEQDLSRLELAAVLHDIGKIGVSDDILLKKAKLSEEEFHQIMLHPDYGEEILSKIPQLKDIIPGVKHHHERFDGRGYPDGLLGENIDITARIIAVADSFDAMTTDRPYRKGFAFEEAFEELRRNAGTQFDPDIIEAFFASDVMEAYFAANARLLK